MEGFSATRRQSPAACPVSCVGSGISPTSSCRRQPLRTSPSASWWTTPWAVASVGLDDLLQAEHLLEQGEDIAHLLLQWHPLQLRIRDEGTLPSEFVCVALMARSLCAEGQLPEAAAFLLRFRQRVEAEGTDCLIPNVDAMRCRLALMEDSLYAANWFAAQPSGDGIWLLPDVYRLLTKVRCHIRREEYQRRPSDPGPPAGSLFTGPPPAGHDGGLDPDRNLPLSDGRRGLGRPFGQGAVPG